MTDIKKYLLGKCRSGTRGEAQVNDTGSVSPVPAIQWIFFENCDIIETGMSPRLLMRSGHSSPKSQLKASIPTKGSDSVSHTSGIVTPFRR